MKKRIFDDLSPLKEVIKIIFQQGPLKKMVSVKQIASIWSEIVGEKIRLHTDVRDMKDGSLYVDVDNPVWSMELKFQEKELLRNLNEKCGNSTIHSIVYRIHSLNFGR